MSGAGELHGQVATPVHGLPDTPPVEVLNLSDLPADLQDILRPRVERLGYLGAFFSLAGYQPEALGGFITFTEALKQALPTDLAEVVALTVAARLGVEYELTQHRRLARSMQLSQTWIDAVTSTVERPSELTSAQQGVRDLSHAVLDDFGRSARPAFERLVAVLGAAKAVAVLLLISRYVAHGCVANTLGLTAPTAVQSVRPAAEVAGGPVAG